MDLNESTKGASTYDCIATQSSRAIVASSSTHTLHQSQSMTQAQNILCSNVMSDSGWRPTQARKMLVNAPRCLAKALTTGVPGGVKGAYGSQ